MRARTHTYTHTHARIQTTHLRICGACNLKSFFWDETMPTIITNREPAWRVCFLFPRPEAFVILNLRHIPILYLDPQAFVSMHLISPISAGVQSHYYYIWLLSIIVELCVCICVCWRCVCLCAHVSVCARAWVSVCVTESHSFCRQL